MPTYAEITAAASLGIDTPWDIDKLVGAIIDAYTLAPNDEDERREYVKATVLNSGWAPR